MGLMIFIFAFICSIFISLLVIWIMLLKHRKEVMSAINDAYSNNTYSVNNTYAGRVHIHIPFKLTELSIAVSKQGELVNNVRWKDGESAFVIPNSFSKKHIEPIACEIMTLYKMQHDI